MSPLKRSHNSETLSSRPKRGASRAQWRDAYGHGKPLIKSSVASLQHTLLNSAAHVVLSRGHSSPARMPLAYCWWLFWFCGEEACEVEAGFQVFEVAAAGSFEGGLEA